MESLSLSKNALRALRLGEGNELPETDVVDIAVLNLLCAAGLPGSPTSELSSILAKLDAMAYRADCEIQRNYHRFLEDLGQFQFSQARFAVLMMITVIQQDFGVRYNPARIHDPDFRNAGDLFLHGLLDGNGGTCASMPVLYTAIGRRLGWPIKLAMARGHVFCRWDDAEGIHPFGPQRFNIEGTGQGAAIVNDDYYRTFPEPISEADINRGVYLKSLNPDEELALFLALRGHCLEDNGWIGKACATYGWACRLAPSDPHYRAFWEHAEDVRDRRLEEETLREYFGNGVPLPFGLFPRHVLRQMASDMRVAASRHFDAQRHAEQAAQEATRERDRLRMLPTRIGPLGKVYREERLPTGEVRHIPVESTGLPPHVPAYHSAWSAIAPLPIPPGLAGVLPQFTPALGSPAGFSAPLSSLAPVDFTPLPARLLEFHDRQQWMLRRGEAIRLCRSLPPNVIIRQPRRSLLSATAPVPLDGPAVALLRCHNPKEP